MLEKIVPDNAETATGMQEVYCRAPVNVVSGTKAVYEMSQWEFAKDWECSCCLFMITVSDLFYYITHICMDRRL